MDHATEQGRTSALVETVQVGTNPQYRYEYDANGNIVKEFCGNTLVCQYGYDAKNQLVSFSYPGLELDDAPAQYVYSYDNQGNLMFVGLTNGMEMETVSSYGYTDASWGDLLTSFNGASITYDAIGNPLSYYDGRTFSWQNGRQLAGVSVADGFALFEYNEEGVRVKKIVDGSFAGVTTYVYDGNLLLRETKTDPVTGAVIHDLYFTYDEAGRPFSMTDTYETLYYAYDLYGNVKYLYDAYGNVNAEYVYNDPWGKSVTFLGSPFELASYNPFTYKGYYYDADLDMFYCGSRYYDGYTCRWINADGQISGVGGDLRGYNQFVYCFNNPVMMADATGNWPDLTFIPLVIIPLVNAFLNFFKRSVVYYDVPLYNQGNEPLCWAYSQVMMEDYFAGRVRDSDSAKARAEEIALEQIPPELWHQGGSSKNRVGLNFTSIYGLASNLYDFGPLYAVYGRYENGKRVEGHMVVVTGANVYTNMVYTNNPWGISGIQSFDDFIQVFYGDVTTTGWRFQKCYYIRGLNRSPR